MLLVRLRSDTEHIVARLPVVEIVILVAELRLKVVPIRDMMRQHINISEIV